MKRAASFAGRILLAAVFVAALVPIVSASAEAPLRSIVVFDAPAVNQPAMAQIERLGGVKVKDLPLVNGSVVYLPSRAAERAVGLIQGVRYVEPDYVVEALKRPAPAPTPTVQTIPWGITRVNAPVVWPTNTGDPIKVAVVDTGIDVKHPDLIDNLKGGMSAVAYTTSYTDDNGHGTHVAGTIAAVNNTLGVVGVAPAADLYAVKVLDRNGSGYVSDIVEGLQWAIANHMNVVNMSLGSSSYSASFDSAVQQSVAAGIVVVAAAGNSGPGDNTVGYPAGFANVIAVSATDSNNNIASFSSRGPQVDLAAPGVSIYSTYKRSSYGTLSGTSMASPHVAGTAALVLASPIGTDDLNGNGAWDPNEVAWRLERKAQDLGATGFDNLYGYGLVRADLAVQP
jgi:subtilisin family serine protease